MALCCLAKALISVKMVVPIFGILEVGFCILFYKFDGSETIHKVISIPISPVFGHFHDALIKFFKNFNDDNLLTEIYLKKNFLTLI